MPAAYVGDAPDDIMAARRADMAGPRRWIAIGIASTPAQADHYRGLGADLIVAHPDELVTMMNDAMMNDEYSLLAVHHSPFIIAFSACNTTSVCSGRPALTRMQFSSPGLA